jgi:hypothetical protein
MLLELVIDWFVHVASVVKERWRLRLKYIYRYARDRDRSTNGNRLAAEIQ